MGLAATSTTIVRRWHAAWRDALACAVAAVLSWMTAQYLFGHPQPLFAAISAIICLSPGLPSHGRQAVGLLIGVATGIVVGELALFLPDNLPLFAIGLAAFVAIMIAAAYGFPPVVPIQTGVSAIMVLAFGPATAGPARMLDVATGAAIGLFFSQIMLTPDPVRMVDEAARDLLDNLALGLGKCADALRRHDADAGEAALRTLSAAHDSVIALDSRIAAARNTARWSLRGRFVAQQVNDLAARYERDAIRLYASSLLFGEAVTQTLRNDQSGVPAELTAHVERVAARCTMLARGEPDADHAAPIDGPVAPEWAMSVAHLDLVEQALAAMGRQPSKQV